MFKAMLAASLVSAILGANSSGAAQPQNSAPEYDGVVHIYGMHHSVDSAVSDSRTSALIDEELAALEGKQSPEEIARLVAMENTIQLVDDETLTTVAAVNLQFHSLFERPAVIH